MVSICPFAPKVLGIRKTSIFTPLAQVLEGQHKYTEEALIRDLKGRSRKAFDYLYDNYSSALYGIVYGVVKNEETADEVLQDVFVKIWNNIDSYDPAKGKLYTWMLNIARNQGIDRLRAGKNEAQRKVKLEGTSEAMAATSLNTHIEGIGLRKLVDHLDKDQRDIIDLLYFKGFTQTEAAEELAIPLGTVKSRVRLAVNKLRKLFD